MAEADLQFLHLAHPEHVSLVVSGSPFATAIAISGIDWDLADAHVRFSAVFEKHSLDEAANEFEWKRWLPEPRVMNM